MSDASDAMSLEHMTILIAGGVAVIMIALGVVFGGFFAERRLHVRLEDLESRTRAGLHTIEMATLRRVEKAGRLPTLDKFLLHWLPNANSMRQKLQAADMNVALGDFAFAALALTAAMEFVFSMVLDLQPVVALIGSLTLGIGLPNLVISWKAKKRGRQFNLLFPEAVDLIVRALRAGLPVQEAIDSVAREIKDPVGGIFRRAQEEIQLGAPIETALWRVSQTIRTDEFNFLVVAMSIQRDTGGNLAETLANLSGLLRARQQLRLKIRAFTSEARTTMLIMTGLPFLVAGVLFILTPNYITPLVATSTGQIVSAAAGVSMGLGILIMNKIATIKV